MRFVHTSGSEGGGNTEGNTKPQPKTGYGTDTKSLAKQGSEHNDWTKP